MAEQKESRVHVPINPTDICYRAFELMNGKQFDDAEKLLNSNMTKVDDNIAIGLFHSALGVLYKLKGEMKKAWRHYERAEKLIPEDPALKIITARLLIDEFAEYEQAIKKAKKAYESIKENPVFVHQVLTTIGLAYVGKGQKKRAIEFLNKSMEGDFEGFITTKNIDFNLVEKLLRKKWAIEESRKFLEKALSFAKTHKEPTWSSLIEKMLAAFPKEK